MKRHREVAAAPVRPAGECWSVIEDIVTDSLSRSPHIDRADVAGAMGAVGGVGRMLVGAGHLDRQPIVVVAGTMHLSITTVSGDEAFSLEETLNPVPGAAGAKEWTVYLPAAEPLAVAVRTAVASSGHLSADPPPADVDGASAAGQTLGDLLDVAAFKRRRETT